MLLVISISTVCMATCIAKASEEEMVRIFSTIVALLSILLTIVLAPWFIQLLILLSVLSWQFFVRNHGSYSKD